MKSFYIHHKDWIVRHLIYGAKAHSKITKAPHKRLVMDIEYIKSSKAITTK